MNTITDKLNKLLETKEAIKTAIKAKNVAVADSEPFSIYASKIGEISTGGGSGFDWSAIGYDGTEEPFMSYLNYSKQIYDNWDIGQTDLNLKFSNDFNLIIMPKVNTDNVTNMRYMFGSCRFLIQVPQLNTSNVTDMEGMFNGCEILKEIPQLDTSKVHNMKQMFANTFNLKAIPHISTGKVYDMSNMFNNCQQLETVPELNTENVTDMNQMFVSCYGLVNIPSLNTISCTNMNNMFAWCSALQSVGKLNAYNLTSATSMFENCTALTNLGGFTDLSVNLDLSSCTSLTAESLMNVINEAKDLSQEGSATLTLGTTNIEKLTEEQIAIATSKGWTIA